MKFTELNLDDQLLEAISYMGFENATPIQEQAIPLILDNRDLIACAQTGTGKTGAFVLPILNKLVGKEDTSVNTLIVVPTRELAIQIEQQIQGLSYFVSVGSMAIYGGGGGKDWDNEKDALVNGRDIIVATPGKLLAHLKLGYVDFSKVKHFVLDEADRMLDMGFIDDLKKIISFLPKEHQTLLFSATMPKSISELAKKILKNPAEIKLSISKPAAGVDQKLYLTHDNQKIPVLCHILKERKNYDSIIVFTSTKSKVSEIVNQLKRSGFPAQGISSNLEQDRREEVLRGFRSKRIRILVATDVMSRGIDIKEINMVVNYDVPHDAEDYVHRVGRTARANTKGEAFTLVNQKDMFRMCKIEELIEMSLPKSQPPEEIGEGPTWEVRASKPKNNKKRYNKNKKKNFKPRKPGGEKNKA
jgi:superfamily II DNA/RNA helicase